MSEKIKTKIEGDTYVIPDDDFSIQNADIKRSGNAEWDDFEVLGKNNKDEAEHVMSSDTDPKKMEAALRLIRRRRVGVSVLGLDAIQNAA